MSEPLTPAFLDSNILVYAIQGSAADVARGPVAVELVARLTAEDRLCVSTQVLQEVFVTVTKKGRTRIEPTQALRYLDRIARWTVFTTDYPAIREAAELSITDSISFWDSLIIVAAARCGAHVLYTEDMQHGRTIKGVRIENPFLTIPPL